MEPNISWPCSQKPATCLYLEPNTASQHLPILFTTYFNIIRLSTSRVILLEYSPHFESNPGGGEVFHNVQTGSLTHPASYKLGTEFFPGVKRPGRGVDHPTPSSTEFKERAELYLYSTSGPSWPVIGWKIILHISHFLKIKAAGA
jgi:hypothetical protein